MQPLHLADLNPGEAPGLISRWVGLPHWIQEWEKWLLTDFIEILLWIIGGILLVRFISWNVRLYAHRNERKFRDSDAIVQTEDSKHRRALVDVVGWTVGAAVMVVVALHVMSIFGLPLTSLAGPRAVVGAALGFGAQRVVQDFLGGFFVVAERQYGYGDSVVLSVSGGQAEGTVEDVSLRATKVRTSDGDVVTVPNGQIIKSTNRSKDWARAVVDVPVPPSVDISNIGDLLDDVGRDFYADPRWHEKLLDEPTPIGITELDLDYVTLRMVARTLPGEQFEVSRALRARIVESLAERGIFVQPGSADGAGAGAARDARHGRQRGSSGTHGS